MELPIAGPGGRSYAFIIDWHIRVLLALGWYVLVALLAVGGISIDLVDKLSSAFVTWVLILPPLAIYLLYHPVLEWLMNGETPGKRIAGIRIVNRNGEPPSLAAILMRNVFRTIDSLPAFYVLGLATTLLTRDQVRIGDLAAGTLLVYQAGTKKKDRSKLQGIGINQQLPASLAALAQDVLERWDSLDPPVRFRLATDLLKRAGVEPPDKEQDCRQRLHHLLEEGP